MQSNKENEARGIALYNSDTDDWTLVSPPVSSSGGSRSSSSPETSPERSPKGALQQLPPLTTLSTILTEVKQSSTTAQLSSSDNANQSSCSRKEAPPPKEKKLVNHRASSGSKVALDGANMLERANDADDESDGLTEVNLDENGIAIIREESSSNVNSDKEDTTDEDDWTDDDAQEIEEIQPRRTTVPSFWTRLFNDITFDQRTSINDASRLEPFVLLALLVCSCSICYIISLFAPENVSSSSPTHQTPRLPINSTFDLLYSDPSNHAYTELKMLNEEIADCIERENPVMRELAHWRSMNPKELSKYKTITNTRPFKGLVCYENEVKWRKRFNYLKTEFNFDLRKITKQIKRKLTNDILVSQHPQTPFELVLNQLEYLDHVEQRRKDRAIERLKAENLELLRRLNKRSEQGERDTKSNYNKRKQQQQEEKNGNSRDQPTVKSLIILESENVRLRREVESLKSRLAEKAGTVYVKQSIELEKCERENSALKQFHQDIADEISKNLLKVGLHKPETFTFMTTSNKDEDSISAKLASTKHFFMKLGDEITSLLERSKDLEKELTESKMLNALVAREAQNLIKEANETKLHLKDNSSRNRDGQVYQNVAHLIRYPAQQYKQPYIMVPDGDHNIREVPYEEKSSSSSLPNPGDFDKDWLSKRAQLREQLRESSRALERHLSDLRQVPRSISSTQSSVSSPSDRFSTPKSTKTHHDSHQSNRYNDIEHRRLNSLKKLNRPTKFSSSSANYYNQNSHKNCKNHHKRDEL